MSVLILAPIVASAADPHTHVEMLRRIISRPSWTTIERDNLKILPMLHMARFQIIEHLIPSMGDDSNSDELIFPYLLFIAEIDGRADDFYDYLYRQEAQPAIGSPESANAGDFVRRIWSHCAGYPSVNDDEIYLFRQFMKRYEFETMIYYPAVEQSRNEILRALCIKELTAVWMLAQQLLPNAASPLLIQGQTQRYLLAVEDIEQLEAVNLAHLYQFLFGPPLPGAPPTSPRAFQGILSVIQQITS